MSPWIIGLIAFACIFGGALLGMLFARVLPEIHLSSDAKDVVRVAMAMVATLAVLVLALLISSAKKTADEKDSELRATGAQFILLDRTMAQYGAETKHARDSLKALLWSRLTHPRGRGWQPGQASPEMAAVPQMGMAGASVASTATGRELDSIQRELLDLSPQTEGQRWLQSEALRITNALEATRWSVLEQPRSSISWPFVSILVFWLTLIFVSFGLFAPRNVTMTVVLFLSAMSVATALYLILELDQPYSGLILKTPDDALQTALEQLGRP